MKFWLLGRPEANELYSQGRSNVQMDAFLQRKATDTLHHEVIFHISREKSEAG